MANIDQDNATGDTIVVNAKQTQNGDGDLAVILQTDSFNNEANQDQSGGPLNDALIDQSTGTSNDNFAEQSQDGDGNVARIFQNDLSSISSL